MPMVSSRCIVSGATALAERALLQYKCIKPPPVPFVIRPRRETTTGESTTTVPAAEAQGTAVATAAQDLECP